MCVICDRRPKVTGGAYCYHCTRDITAERRDNEARLRWWDKAEYVLVWHGHVVSLVEQGEQWHPVYEGMPTVGPVPAEKLIDLHKAHSDFGPQMVKRMKGAVRAYMPAM